MDFTDDVEAFLGPLARGGDGVEEFSTPGAGERGAVSMMFASAAEGGRGLADPPASPGLDPFFALSPHQHASGGVVFAAVERIPSPAGASDPVRDAFDPPPGAGMTLPGIAAASSSREAALAADGAGADDDDAADDDGSGDSPEERKRKRKLMQQNMDRKRRKRLNGTIDLLRAETNTGKKSDKAAVLDSALAELRRLREENSRLREAARPADVPADLVSGRQAGRLTPAQLGTIRDTLQRSSFYAQLFVGASVGLMAQRWDTGKIVDVNGCVTRELGYSEEELIGYTWPEAMANHFGPRMAMLCCTGEVKDLEGTLKGGVRIDRSDFCVFHGKPTSPGGDSTPSSNPPSPGSVDQPVVQAPHHHYRGTCGIPGCLWGEDEAILLSGEQDAVVRIRSLPYADGRLGKLIATRYLVRDSVTKDPRYFVTVGQMMPG